MTQMITYTYVMRMCNGEAVVIEESVFASPPQDSYPFSFTHLK